MNIGRFPKRPVGDIKRFSSFSKARNLKVKMLAAFIPVVVATLVATGYLTYQISNHFILVALEKAALIHVVGLADDMEQSLEKYRKDLSVIAQEPPTPANLSRYLATIREIEGTDYRILAFISQKNSDHVVCVAMDKTVKIIPFEMVNDFKPNLLTFYENIRDLKPGETWISKVQKLEYPFPLPDDPNQMVSSSAIYLGTRCSSSDGTTAGYLILAVDIRSLNKILSAYHQQQSRIWTSSENGEDQYSYFFDTAGWILFDSGTPKEAKGEISTELARFGYTGILGSPEQSSSFKPDTSFKNFWTMVDQVKAGKYGSIKTANLELQSPGFKEHFCAYAPVHFATENAGSPIVYGGVAFVDRSRLTEAAIYRQIDVMFTIILSAIILVSLVIFFLAYFITKPFIELARAVDAMQQTGKLEPIQMPRAGYEISLLRNSINSMILKIKEQIEQIKVSEREREIAALRAKAGIEEMEESASHPGMGTYAPSPEIAGMIGASTRIEALRSEILKAAKVDMDVLIVGETGTGKQLTAEAIHRYGRRSAKPFVSINCGELDEHLLLDTLFGHVRGAFTEAKTDRKGAFVEANGGILFLDEVQTASSAVQQALLRVVSQRKIKHLGSDKDTDVDVRVIAATNADLKELVDHGKFRQDLYFRLKVITLYTPPLREIREDIPLLVRHYFAEAKKLTLKKKLTISKGALEKLKQYDWPGNVREMMNCINRAVVMAESAIIQSEDLILESDEERTSNIGGGLLPASLGDETKAGNGADHSFGSSNIHLPNAFLELTHRQQKAYRHIIEKGSITRLEYQALVGDNLPPRTAIYDLHDLVRKGLIEKKGKGPATRYTLCESQNRSPIRPAGK
jgi:two-component system, NtrC family, response regulator HydG